MHISDVRCYIGRDAIIEFTDRNGDLMQQTTHVHDINYVPMYGACIVGDMDDIWLEKVTSISQV